MTSPRPPEDRDVRTLDGVGTALRSAQPRPRPAFLEELDSWMQAELTGAAAATGQPWAAETAHPTIRVLVADAHPLVREALIHTLERGPGIEVIGQADDGMATIELADALEPDVIVLDVRTPGLGGAQGLERLCRRVPGARVLVVTSDESPESLLDAVAAGAAGYLLKRRSGEDLPQAVITVYGGGSVITPELAGWAPAVERRSIP